MIEDPWWNHHPTTGDMPMIPTPGAGDAMPMLPTPGAGLDAEGIVRVHPTLTDFLLARIAEDEETATPRTVVISGGWPAPEVPNCVGPDGRGGCDWWMEDRGVRGWWRELDVLTAMEAHSRTHATAEQKRTMAECGAKLKIVELHDGPHECSTYDHNGDVDNCTWCLSAEECSTLRLLATVYADHPGFREEWRA